MDKLLSKLYGHDEKTIEHQKNRYRKVLEKFKELFPQNTNKINF